MLPLNNKILITGSHGFVGLALTKKLFGHSLVLMGRREDSESSYPYFRAEINSGTDYSVPLVGVTTVIHCAARVHIMNDPSSDPLKAFREVNTLGTLNLARQAAAAGVKRFIFISTIKVNGESTCIGRPFTTFDQPNAIDPYGISKMEAELELRTLCAGSGMEFVIIRPPLVYGPGVKANFAAMLKLAKQNLPLPLGAIHNKRSLVAVENLVDLVVTCISHPNAANQVFLVSDDHDVSTTELLQMMTRAYGKTPMLMPIPAAWLRWLASMAGKQAVIDRLCGNLQVDITFTKQTLGWRPPVSLQQGIEQCANRM